MKETPSLSLSGHKSVMKILIDADVIIELFLNRSGFVEDAEKLFNAATCAEDIEFYITNKCLERIRIEKNGEQSARELETMLQGHIVYDNDNYREQARRSSLKDFDSAEELACAITLGYDAIVTMNPQNFDGVLFSIWSIEDLLIRLNLENNLKVKLSARYPVQVEPSHELPRNVNANFVNHSSSDSMTVTENGVTSSNLHQFIQGSYYQKVKVLSPPNCMTGGSVPYGWHPNIYLKYLAFFDPREIWEN